MMTFVLQGESPLWTASCNGHVGVVKALINAGAKVNQTNKVCIHVCVILLFQDLCMLVPPYLQSEHVINHAWFTRYYLTCVSGNAVFDNIKMGPGGAIRVHMCRAAVYAYTQVTLYKWTLSHIMAPTTYSGNIHVGIGGRPT